MLCSKWKTAGSPDPATFYTKTAAWEYPSSLTAFVKFPNSATCRKLCKFRNSIKYLRSLQIDNTLIIEKNVKKVILVKMPYSLLMKKLLVPPYSVTRKNSNHMSKIIDWQTCRRLLHWIYISKKNSRLFGHSFSFMKVSTKDRAYAIYTYLCQLRIQTLLLYVRI